MKPDQKAILHYIIWELQKIYNSKEESNLQNIINLKNMLSELENQKLINLDEQYNLEVYLFGILSIINSKK